MNDSDDIKLKAEIDKIMANVHNIIKKIKMTDPDRNHDAGKNRD